jgi:hypothetical protein
MSHPEAERPMTILAANSHKILIDTDIEFLGTEFFMNIRWIHGAIFNAKFSVFSKDDLGVELEVFRAKSEEDAEIMQAFLNIKSVSTAFYKKESDDLNLIWEVFEKFSEKKIGESYDRVSAEYFGIEYQKKHNIPIFVSSRKK